MDTTMRKMKSDVEIIDLQAIRKASPQRRKVPEQPLYVVEIRYYGEEDRNATAAWNEMWRMLFEPLIHPKEMV